MNVEGNLRHIAQSPIWNEVKKWNKEDKVDLITLLSISLAQTPVEEETPEQKTQRMIAKHAGCWRGSESAEDIIRMIDDSKHSSMEPLKL